jgi:hypothetical protein
VPYTFDFDWKHRILRCRFRGRVTDEELREFYRAGYKHAFRTRPRAGLVDMSEITLFDVSPQAIRELAKSAPIIPDPHHVRVIIAPSPDTYGIARMFELQAEETRPNLYVVRSEREAWAILAVQNPRFAPLEIE